MTTLVTKWQYDNLFYNFIIITMSDKELIKYILSHECFTTNLHYQNIINTLWHIPPIQNISLLNKPSRIMVYLTYSVTSENYALFKQALWFGEIRMKVFNGKIEPPFTFIATIKLSKSDIWIREVCSEIDSDSLKLFYQEWNQIVNNIDGSQEDISCKDSVSVMIINDVIKEPETNANSWIYARTSCEGV